MTITAENFILDGIGSSTYGLKICEIGGGDGVNRAKIGASINISNDKSMAKNNWSILSKQYDTPISFSFDLCRFDANGLPNELSQSEIRQISRWIHQGKNLNYRQFQFLSTDIGADVIYMVDCSDMEKIVINGKVVGFTVNFISNLPFGVTPKKDFNIYMTTSNLEYTLLNSDDEVMNYIYPDLKIVILENSDFSIYNDMTKETFKIYGCKNGEIIRVNGETLEITSSVRSNSQILNSFNNVFLALTNTFKTQINKLTIVGKANVTISFSLPRKVGV